MLQLDMADHIAAIMIRKLSCRLYSDTVVKIVMNDNKRQELHKWTEISANSSK
jgi:hypothetical protein